MPWSRVFSISDPSACHAVIRTADVELLPTAKGRFHAQIAQIGMNRLLIHRFHVSLPQVSTVAVRPGRTSIGFLTELNSSPFLHCGQEVSPGDIIVNRFDVAHQRSDANLHFGAMSLPIDDLDAAAETIIGRELPRTPHRRIIRPNHALTLRLLKLHKSVAQLAHDAAHILELPEVLRGLENELIHIMVSCLAEGTAVEPTAGSRRHDMIIARFEEFLETHPDQPLYLPEICAEIGVAERTLRASCEEHLGMGPIRYLTLRRMHLVRRTLLRSDPSKASVTQIVTDHGFWELGRFSVAYRTLFGESPSRTLRRPAERPEVYFNPPSSLAATDLRPV
ncbi:AraC family transcriptional regulator [Bradyrhizobium manausense]|uniref:AraC family transcriptional regulator n=1 Tax=Bradyrhizobium TaxID=374 RepID=UPI001BAA330D|nr:MULTISPECIES: helix-turn-helix domain-containing protein [Bradyrhizobium]MBR0830725.1 AraC family transcriptional regulator [Bradyrhizobium manausense]UVO28734.1 helix-turn-helix domain-containing protein [Bradyrhizobium arachidis]